MKRISKIFFSIVSALVFAIGCSEVDKLSERVDSLEGRVTALETLTSTLNDNIVALQKLAGGSTINSVALKDGVYTITLSNGETLTINQGAVGVGNAPIMSIDSEGYWMVDYGKGAEYILVGGEKVKAVGSNGVTPKFSVDAEGYWTVSYDGGTTYARVKDEAGNPVKAVVDGSSAQDSFFDDVKYENGVLTIVPKGGEPLVLPVISSFLCAVKDAADVQVFSYGQTRTYNVEQKGVASAIVTAPEGWTAILTDTQLSITAPAGTKATIADSSTDVSILAISTQGLATVAKVRVMVEGGTVVVNPSATVTFTSADASSATFEVSVSDVTGWKYICQAASEPAPSAETLAANGTESTTGTVVVEGLAAETEYILYVLPYNGETLGAIASATGKTTAATVVDYPGLYGKYMKGEDVVICGVTINKTTHPDANYISAESEDKTIKAGVNFVAPDANALFSTVELPMPLYVAGNTEGTRSPIKTDGQIKLASATDTQNTFAMENVDLTAENITTNYLIANWYDFAIEKISIANCGITLPDNKSLIYVNKDRPVNAFSMTDSDVKVSQTDASKNINMIQTTETYTMTEVNFTNNVFWSPADVKGFNLLLNRKVTAANLTVSHNTLVNLYPAASYAFCQVNDMTAGNISNNLFYLVNYTASANDTYTGIVREMDGTCPDALYETFVKNYAIYGDSVPTKKMKVGQNSSKGQIFNKKKVDSAEIFDYEDGSANFDLVNGIFKPKNASYGAQR